MGNQLQSILNRFTFRRFVIVFVFLLSFQQIAKAQEANKSVTVTLQNGKFFQIQICNESIVRVRISDQKEFPKSLMERYGILKSDWDQQNIR